MLQILPKKEFEKIKDSSIPKFEKLSLIADMCRLNTFVAVKKAGSGHLGSSFSAMDIAIYLYYEKMNTLEVGLNSPDRDIYFSSKGHDVPGLYSIFYSIGILSKDKLLKLRRLNGLDGHPEINIPGIEASTGSLGMGISKGKGMAWAKKYLNHNGHVYVLVGDGELQEGQIYEALQTTVHQKIQNITIIVDRNKYQTDKTTEDIISLKNLVDKFNAFGWYVDRVNGHDYEQLEQAFFKSEKEKHLPKIIIADTVKGKGISFMEPSKEENLYEWHSGAPDDNSFKKGFEELYSKINHVYNEWDLLPLELDNIQDEVKISRNVSSEYIAEAYGDELVKIAEKREDIIVLDGDLSADCKIRRFENKFPNRFIENGIAEQDMVSMAGGLAAQGLLPIVNSFASFLASRPNEQIYNNATEGNKIIYVCHFAGMIPAGPGKSHQSVRDISLFSALPNVTIFQPCNSNEVRDALRYFVAEEEGVCVLRMNIGPSPQIIEHPLDYKFKKGVGSILADGNDACIIAYGPVMLNEALNARKILLEYNINIRLVNMPWLNFADSDFFQKQLLKNNRNYILEDHMVVGGLFDKINAEIVKQELSLDIASIGLIDYPKCGNPIEILEYSNLNSANIAKIISNDLGKNIDDHKDDAGKDYSFSPQ